jgi:hypothetical protein
LKEASYASRRESRKRRSVFPLTKPIKNLLDVESGSVGFTLLPDELDEFMGDHATEKLAAIDNGIQYITKGLCTSLHDGLTMEEAESGFIERKQR